MNTRFVNDSPENSGGDSPRSAVASTSSSKRSRRSAHKRAVLVPIGDGDQMRAPPSDSWAWRKYGQKPIKGSPYPRGYYRCSSSKGCPARKQVERSRVEPKMLVVTYYCEHNHNSPESKHRATTSAAAITARNVKTPILSEEEEEEDDEEEEEEVEEKPKPKPKPKPRANLSNQSHEKAAAENKISDTILVEAAPLVQTAEFGWFSDFETTAFTMLEMESSMLTEEMISTDAEMAMIFTMREEEEESLFADLGELPECSTVFRRGMVATTG